MSKHKSLLIIFMSAAIVIGILYGMSFYKLGLPRIPYKRYFVADSSILTFKTAFTVEARIQHIVFDKGRFYIANYVTGSIDVLDSLGQLLHSIGRRGRGPNEFQLLMDMAIDNDSIYAFDARQQVLFIIDTRGKVIRTRSLPSQENFIRGTKLNSQSYIATSSKASSESNDRQEIFRIVNIQKSTVQSVPVKRRIEAKDAMTRDNKVDGFFVRSASNRIFRVSYRSGEFVAFDSTGGYLFTKTTVDRSPATEFSSNKEGDLIRFKPTGRVINLSGFADHQYLYIYSNALSPEIASKTPDMNAQGVVDIYNVQNGEYVKSFVLPEYQNFLAHKVVLIKENLFCAVYAENIVVLYNLKHL